MEMYPGVTQRGKDLSDYGFLIESAEAALDELAWWARALKAGRGEEIQGEDRAREGTEP
jgi:hypothetical protein